MENELCQLDELAETSVRRVILSTRSFIRAFESSYGDFEPFLQMRDAMIAFNDFLDIKNKAMIFLAVHPYGRLCRSAAGEYIASSDHAFPAYTEFCAAVGALFGDRPTKASRRELWTGLISDQGYERLLSLVRNGLLN